MHVLDSLFLRISWRVSMKYRQMQQKMKRDLLLWQIRNEIEKYNKIKKHSIIRNKIKLK